MSDTLSALQATILDRKDHPREGSYTCSLFQAGESEILKKLGEEAVEVVVAGALQGDDRMIYESADLVYHLLVALVAKGLTWEAVEAELARRFK
ncbi:MAG: phosphoribosyl-ATP diphosphatase [Anaerolineae bacterium]